MKKNFNKKLNLNKQIVSRLQPEEMNRIAAGDHDSYCVGCDVETYYDQAGGNGCQSEPNPGTTFDY